MRRKFEKTLHLQDPRQRRLRSIVKRPRRGQSGGSQRTKGVATRKRQATRWTALDDWQSYPKRGRKRQANTKARLVLNWEPTATKTAVAPVAATHPHPPLAIRPLTPKKRSKSSSLRKGSGAVRATKARKGGRNARSARGRIGQTNAEASRDMARVPNLGRRGVITTSTSLRRARSTSIGRSRTTRGRGGAHGAPRGTARRRNHDGATKGLTTARGRATRGRTTARGRATRGRTTGSGRATGLIGMSVGGREPAATPDTAVERQGNRATGCIFDI